MTLMLTMPDSSVDMTLTDIPYNVVNRGSGGLRIFDKGNADIKTFEIKDFVEQVVRVTSGSIYIFCASEQLSEIRKLLVEFGLTTRLCIWEKTNPSVVNGQLTWLSGVEVCIFGRNKKATFNEHCKNTVWRYPTVRKKSHPTEKSFNLFCYLIKASSNAGDIIFDPCVGSGTTAAAAVATGRNFIAIELDKNYVDYATERVDKQEKFNE